MTKSFGQRRRCSLNAWRHISIQRTTQLGLRCATLLLAASLVASPITADTLIIGNDPGGRIDLRQRAIRLIRQAGDRVEIRGGFCNSACTMYLGLPNMCVSASTVFGFHGPSSGAPGIPLRPANFEKWSRVMSENYPAPLRNWFMADARYELSGIKRVRGRDIINMGVQECS